MAGLFESIKLVTIILFFAGMALITIELFIPGIGIFGGLGAICLVLAIVFQANTFLQGLILFLIIAAIVAVLALIVARSFRKGRLYRSSLVLKNEAKREEGYVSNDDNSSLVGKSGVSLSILRPSGRANIDGMHVDVVTDGEFVDAGEKVVVVASVGRRIVVKKEEE
jgi:membrane-bound ClpP family serine protease